MSFFLSSAAVGYIFITMLDRKKTSLRVSSIFRRALVSAIIVMLCLASGALAGPKILDSKHKRSPDSDNPKVAAVSKKSVSSPELLRRDANSKRLPSSAASKDAAGDRLRSKLSAKSAIILDSRTNEAIYAYNENVRRQPASTIKILTGLISIDALNNEQAVPISHRAENMPRSKVYLKRGKQYRASDLINAVLLSSANDASVALAEKISGSESEFANRMTQTARKLGARDTVCKTASGLTAKGQCSTVHDLAVMFNQAMKNSEFAKRMGRTKVHTSEGKTLWSHNKALWRISGAVGGKTGYTMAARQTYVGKFRQGDDEFVVAIMGSETMWDDINRLVRHGFKLVAERPDVPPDSVKSQLAMLKLNLLHSSGQDSKLEILTATKKNPKFNM